MYGRADGIMNFLDLRDNYLNVTSFIIVKLHMAPMGIDDES